MPVKFRSDAIIQITNLIASRLREILRLTGYWNGTQLYFVWLRLYHYFSGVVWRVLRYSGHLNFTMEIHIVEKCLYWNGPQYTTKKPLIWCILLGMYVSKLHWRHNDHDGVSNHQPHGCLLNRLFRRSSKSKHQSSASLAFVWGIQRDRWIPLTKGQLRGKCFYLMMSSWERSSDRHMFITAILILVKQRTFSEYRPGICLGNVLDNTVDVGQQCWPTSNQHFWKFSQQ